MILGILSDTHGDDHRAAMALRLLKRVGATAFVHCGDVGGTEVLDVLAGEPVWIVCGNTDCPDTPKVNYAASLGLTIGVPPPIRFELDGRRFALFHGHEREFQRVINHALESGELPPDFDHCDYLLHGHTHVACDAYVGPVRVINPGALHRALVYTAATLDVETDRLAFWQIGDDVDDTAPTRADEVARRTPSR